MKNNITIVEVHTNEPKIVVLKDDSPILILEENKLTNKRCKYPLLCKNLVVKMYGITESTILNVEPKYKISNPYIGLGYDTQTIHGVAQSKNLYYKLYDFKFIQPREYFNDTVKLLKLNKKIGWFQGKHRIGYSIDLNRCILENKKIVKKIKNKLPDEIKKYTLMHRIVDLYGGLPLMKNIECYSVRAAIELLKQKEIDVLCISNMILSLKEEELWHIN